MTDKVEKLTKRLNSKKLAKTYPRVERKNTTLSPEYLSDDVSRYYPPVQAGNVYAAAKEPPFEEYELEQFPITRGHSRQQRNSFRIPLV